MYVSGPREQVGLSAEQHHQFAELVSVFEVAEEHVLDPALMFYICR